MPSVAVAGGEGAHWFTGDTYCVRSIYFIFLGYGKAVVLVQDYSPDVDRLFSVAICKSTR